MTARLRCRHCTLVPSHSPAHNSKSKWSSTQHLSPPVFNRTQRKARSRHSTGKRGYRAIFHRWSAWYSAKYSLACFPLTNVLHSNFLKSGRCTGPSQTRLQPSLHWILRSISFLYFLIAFCPPSTTTAQRRGVVTHTPWSWSPMAFRQIWWVV